MSTRTDLVNLRLQLDPGTKKFLAETNSLNKKMDEPGKRLNSGFVRAWDNFAYRAARTSALIQRSITQPIMQLGKESIQVAQTVADGLGEIQTLLVGSVTVTTQKMEGYRDELINLSTEIVKSVSDMTGGLYEYISAFGELPNTMEGYKIAAKVATAGLTSTTQAVDLLSSVSLAYGDTSTKTQQKIADLAFETVRLAKTHIPELADNIAKVAPVASIMNVSLEDVFATTATLIGVTGDTTEVFTQMRRVMLSMQKPNQTMVELLAHLGYVGSLAGKELLSAKGLKGAILDINRAATDMGLSVEKAVGRIQGIMPVLAFQSQEVQERYDRMYHAMEKPGGASESALEKYLEGIASASKDLDEARINFENLRIELGNRLMPKLTEFYNMLSDLFTKILAKASFPSLDFLLKSLGDILEAVSNISEKWLKFWLSLISGLMMLGALLGPVSALMFTIEALIKGVKLLGATFVGKFLKSLVTIKTQGSVGLAVFHKGIVALSSSMLWVAGIITAAFITIGITAVRESKRITNSFLSTARSLSKEYDEFSVAINKSSEAFTDSITTAETAADAFMITYGRRYQVIVEYAEAERLQAEMTSEKIVLEAKKAAIESAGWFRKLNSYISAFWSWMTTQASKGWEKMSPKDFAGIGEFLDKAQEGFEGEVLPGLEAVTEELDNLNQKLESVKANMQDLGKQQLDIEVNLLPEARAKMLAERIAKILEHVPTTLNLGLFDVSEFFDVHELNKFRNLVNETTSEFEDMGGELSGKIAEADSYVQRLNTSLLQITADLNDPSVHQYNAEIVSALFAQERILTRTQEQAVEYKERLEEIYEILGPLASASEFIANQYYEITKEVNKYENALSDIEKLSKEIAKGTYPPKVIARLREARVEAWKIVDAYEAQQRELQWLYEMPELLASIPGAKDIWVKIKSEAFDKSSMQSMLASVNAMLNSPDVWKIDPKAIFDLNALSAYLEGALKVDIEVEVELSHMEKAMWSTSEGFEIYMEALESLRSGMEDLGRWEKQWVNETITARRKAWKEAARFNKISEDLVSLNKTLSFDNAYTEAYTMLFDYHDGLEAIQEIESELAKFRDDVSSDYIDRLELMLAILNKQKEAAEDAFKELKNLQTLYTGQLFEIEIDANTGKLQAELTDIGKMVGKMISGAIDPITGLVSLFVMALLKVPEVQEVLGRVLDFFTGMAEVLGPALANIIIPFLDVMMDAGSYIGLILVPLLDQLAPLFHMLAIILDAWLTPALSILAPIISLVAGIFEMMMPIIALVAKLLVLVTAPLQYLGEILSWSADMIKGIFHNIGLFIASWLAHPFSGANRREYRAERGGYTDLGSEQFDLDSRIDKVGKDIWKQVTAIDEALDMGAGRAGEDLSASTSWYSDVYADPTNPFAIPDDGSSGQGASIQQMTQNNYININVGAIAGNFDEFVLLVQQRMYELREVS